MTRKGQAIVQEELEMSTRASRWIVPALFLAGLLLVSGDARLSRAADPCRESCDRWLARCLRECADAPVPADCRANCRQVEGQCLDQCAADDG